MNTDAEEDARRDRVRCLDKRAIHKRGTISVRLHPALIEMAKARSKEQGYAGGVNGYLGGLILFDTLMSRKHWLTPDAMNDPGILEQLIDEVQHTPPADWPAYFEVRIDELATPATEGQLRRLRFYGVDFPVWLKKGAAKKMIDDFKAAHPESEAAYKSWKENGAK